MTLDEAFSSPDAKRRFVRRLFGTIAHRYDLITRVLSFGRDRHWKARLVKLAAPASSERALDLACGTGDLACAVAERGGRVVGLDLTEAMIDASRRRDTPAKFLVGDMMALPFADRSFEVVTTGYGIRNVPGIDGALKEVYRVLRPGGRFWSLDFDRPDQPVLRAIYLGYLTVVGSLLGLALHRDPDTYRYIPASISRYPGARRVADTMRGLGFREVRVHPVLGGLMAIHGAVKGSPAEAA